MLVATLIAAVGLGVVQLALTAHVRSTLTACASEGARVAAVARQGDDAGVARAATCAADALGVEADVAVAPVDIAGRAGVALTVSAPAPALIRWHAGVVEADARALREGDDAP